MNIVRRLLEGIKLVALVAAVALVVYSMPDPVRGQRGGESISVFYR